MKTRSQLTTALLILLACGIAYLVYGLYQRSSAEQERLQHDASRIGTMIQEHNAEQQ